MSHLFRTPLASGPRKAAKETQGHSQLHISNQAGNQLMEFRLQNASQKHVKISRHGHCKSKALDGPFNRSSGILGIIWFALLVALVITTRVVSLYNNLSSAHPCGHCQKKWISYYHNCYYIGVEKKTWNDSLVSCPSKNSTLLYIDSEEEQGSLANNAKGDPNIWCIGWEAPSKIPDTLSVGNLASWKLKVTESGGSSLPGGRP
ncbi:NKG2-A/NKG2-B type II integral membrane protein-like [Peromyscus californicus insignis]|uniref:NKG2-A/NKG2-B type II integral membrane protein-like n=1 Tax=Peromyscus californicus insignis TaxID=564181 RepID=UPI0022A68733|nr:NKG2-A/NKG2-B type II integral membrane protein-like [Peromyscus californicus insignis]